MSESLYFIAIVPPGDIQREITKLKQEIADRFGSSHALKSPPHITLHMPFKWKDKRFEELHQLMENVNNELEPFEITLQDFDFFEPRVVFVDVVENLQLEILQKKVAKLCRQELKLHNANHKDRPFHPHVTIGFRDLKKAMFYEAKAEFDERSVSFNFSVEKVELLKHNGIRWEVVDF